MEITRSARGWVVSGELDARVSEPLDHALADLPDEIEVPIEIDLAGVTFIDSSGLRVLLRLAERIASAGGSLQVVNPSTVVARLVVLTKLGSTFGLTAEESDASAE